MAKDYKKELEDLVSTVQKENGSDLHIAEGRRPTIRVAGSLIPILKKEVFTNDDIWGILEQFFTPENKKKFLEDKQLDFAYSHGPHVRFRGNAYYQQGTISVALRLIPQNIKTIQDLNLPPVLATFAQKQQGFFIVVGPAGQGKSTTLAAIIEMINTERLEHIVTIEDPIEYIFTPKKSIIDQREIRVDAPDFHSALWAVFRQDIDVVMIGEMRQPATMATAVTAAETGHLVFSTLHTNSASQTVDRIIDSFPPEQQAQIRLQLAGSLIGIFSQRLIPRISGGLIPAYELLINNTAVANVIRDKRTHEINTIIETSSGEGMIDLNRSLVSLVRAGEITVENAYKFSNNPKVLDKLL
jgi:twitching motility protein PilT